MSTGNIAGMFLTGLSAAVISLSYRYCFFLLILLFKRTKFMSSLTFVSGHGTMRLKAYHGENAIF